MSSSTCDINTFRELPVYQRAFQLQQTVFFTTKGWPAEEAYALTGQVRRSSRSVGANVAEAWGKRRYPAQFLSKLSDADGELQETHHWLITALACGYLNATLERQLVASCQEIGGLLGSAMALHQRFCGR